MCIRDRVKENSENPITGISYDGSTYDVSIQVDDQNGTLNVTNVSITKDSVPAELRFTNTYTPEDITLGEDGNAALGGTKTVTPTPGTVSYTHLDVYKRQCDQPGKF